MGEILSALLKQYYDRGGVIPREVLVPEPLDDQTLVEEWLTDTRGKRVSVLVPKRGAGRDLLAMATENAKAVLQSERSAADESESTLAECAAVLHLKKIPRRIECFDISGLQGRHAVGSMVVFLEGKADTSSYRRFKIKAGPEAGDYGMMYEMLSRRYTDKKDLPDLIVVDGGRGQLGVALAVLSEQGIDGIDAVGLAKEARIMPGKQKSLVRKDEDRVYLPNRKNPLYLSSAPSVLRLLQHVRDEAHRFAVTYHRSLKRHDDFRSDLDGIVGIGEAKKRALLSHFKNIEDVKKAAVEELVAVDGIGPALAVKIRDYFDLPRKV